MRGLAGSGEAGAPRNQRQEGRAEGGRGEQGRAPGRAVPERLRPAGLSCLNTVSHQYFWYHITLKVSEQMEEGVKSLVPKLTLDIFTVWLIVFIVMRVGVKLSVTVSTPSPGLLASSPLHVPPAPGIPVPTRLTPSRPPLFSSPHDPPTHPENKLRAGPPPQPLQQGVLRKTMVSLEAVVPVTPLTETCWSPAHGRKGCALFTAAHTTPPHAETCRHAAQRRHPSTFRHLSRAQ